MPGSGVSAGLADSNGSLLGLDRGSRPVEQETPSAGTTPRLAVCSTKILHADEGEQGQTLGIEVLFVLPAADRQAAYSGSFTIRQ